MLDINKIWERYVSLTIFKEIDSDSVIDSFEDLISCDFDDSKNRYDFINNYTNFCLQLFEETDNWSEYLLSVVLGGENVCTGLISQGKVISDNIKEAMLLDLQTLQELSEISSDEIQELIGYDRKLPSWKISKIDFKKEYEKFLRDIPIKGCGIFANYNAFYLTEDSIVGIDNPHVPKLENLSEYEEERGKVIKNTQALLNGAPANNMLLYGDAGTGKSTTIKAVSGHFADKGLRIIEVNKSQLHSLPAMMQTLIKNPLKFIVFIDDLSFSSNDSDFTALKAILEGSLFAKGSNTVIYATSNRRHLIKESLSDRDGDDVHLNDTLQESMSLSARFGVIVNFMRPSKDIYLSIVRDLTLFYGVEMDKNELEQKAEAYAIRNGGRSPRTAQQFAQLLASSMY